MVLPADNGTHLLMYALKPIAEGEEATQNYQEQVIHRVDLALAIYGRPHACTCTPVI